MNDNENILQEKDLLNDERISRFLQGKMKADEEATFIEEMKNNADLRNQAIAQASLVKGMKQVDEELKDAFRQTTPIAYRLTVAIGRTDIMFAASTRTERQKRP